MECVQTFRTDLMDIDVQKNGFAEEKPPNAVKWDGNGSHEKLDGRTGLVYNNDNSRVHGKSGEILRGHTGYGGSLPCSGYKR